MSARDSVRSLILDVLRRLLPCAPCKAVNPMKDANAIMEGALAARCTVSKLPAEALLPCGRNFVAAHVLKATGGKGALRYPFVVRNTELSSTIRLSDREYR